MGQSTHSDAVRRSEDETRHRHNYTQTSSHLPLAHLRDIFQVEAAHRVGNAWTVASDGRAKAVLAEIAITTARAVPRGAAQVNWERWIIGFDYAVQPLDAMEQYRRQGDAPLLAAYAISHDVERRAKPICAAKVDRELIELHCALVPDLQQESAVSADMLCHRASEVRLHGIVAPACDCK